MPSLSPPSLFYFSLFLSHSRVWSIKAALSFRQAGSQQHIAPPAAAAAAASVARCTLHVAYKAGVNNRNTKPVLMRWGNPQAATCTIWRPTLCSYAVRKGGRREERERRGERGSLRTMLSVNKSLCPNEDHGNLFQTVFILFFTTWFWFCSLLPAALSLLSLLSPSVCLLPFIA